MENRDSRRAMRHLHRAQELLNQTQLGFGTGDDGPMPVDNKRPASSKNITDLRAHDPEFGPVTWLNKLRRCNRPERGKSLLSPSSEHKFIAEDGYANFTLKGNRAEIDLMIRDGKYIGASIKTDGEFVISAGFSPMKEFDYKDAAPFISFIKNQYSKVKHYELKSFKKFKADDIWKGVGKEVISCTMEFLVSINHLSNDDMIVLYANPVLVDPKDEEDIKRQISSHDTEKLINHYKSMGFERYISTQFMYAPVRNLWASLPEDHASA